ncbi:MAG TPA: endonuclease/exonuclease/phosphatase family protein [Vulgatibacter sp.]
MIRVATYNILHGALKGLDAIRDVLEAIDPDLVALQEVDRGVARSGRVDQAAWLAAHLGLDHAFACACPWEGGEYGLAILSRFPIAGTRLVRLPSRAILSLADGAEPRIMLAATVEAPGGLLHFACTHLGLHPTERSLQAEAIAAAVFGRERLLLCGDLNEGHTEPAFVRLAGRVELPRPADSGVAGAPGGELHAAARPIASPFGKPPGVGESESLQPAGLIDCIGECAPLPLRTYPSHAPTIGIDHVLRSPDLPPARAARAVDTQASDHLPVVVDLG